MMMMYPGSPTHFWKQVGRGTWVDDDDDNYVIVMVTLCPLSKNKEEQMIAVLISPDGPLQPVVFLMKRF